MFQGPTEFLLIGYLTELVNSTPTNTARTELHSMITFHHANTRGSSLRTAHLCPQNSCHPRVMSRFLPHLTLTTSTSSLSPISSISPTFPTVSPLHTGPMILDPYIPCDVARQSGGSTQIPSLTGYEPKSLEINAIDTEAIDPEDLEPRRIDRNLGTDPYQREERFVRSSTTEDTDEFGKVGAEMSHLQSQMHSDCDSAESIAVSDLEDGELRKMLASPLNMQSREECESSRMPIARVKPAALLQERGARAKRTQADSRKSLMSSSSQERRAPEKPAALCFHQEPKNHKTKSRVLFSKTLIRQIWEHLLLKVTKIICWVRQELKLWSKNTKSDLSVMVSVSSSNKLTLKGWNYMTHNTDLLNLEGKGSPTYSDPKHARSGRNEKSSRTSSWRSLSAKIKRKSWDNTKAHFSMNDWGGFQEVESNYSGGLSYVSSQPAMIPSSRSMLSRDKRLPLDTWNTSGLRENVFGNQFSTFDSRRDHPQGIHSGAPLRERGPVPQATGSQTLFARDDKQNRGTSPMPTFAGRPSTIMSATMRVDFPQNSMDGQRREQISELQSDKFLNPQSFLVWKVRFKNQVTTCSLFPSEAMLWIKEVEMVDSVEELKSSRSVSGKNFSNFWDAGREDCFCSEQDHPEFPIQEEGQSRGTESPEGGPVPTRKTDRFSWSTTAFEWLALMTQY